MERWWKVPLAGEGRKPRLHRRHRVYKLVEDTKHRPKDNLELILTQSVDGRALLSLRQVPCGSSFLPPLPLRCLRPFPSSWEGSAPYWRRGGRKRHCDCVTGPCMGNENSNAGEGRERGRRGRLLQWDNACFVQGILGF